MVLKQQNLPNENSKQRLFSVMCKEDLTYRGKKQSIQFVWIPESPQLYLCSGIDNNYPNFYH